MTRNSGPKSTQRSVKIQPPRYSSYSPGSPTDGRSSKRPEPTEPLERSWPKILRRGIVGFFLLIFMAVLIIAVWDERNISSASQKMFGSGNLFDLLSRTPLKGSDRGRINVLLVGYSVDDPSHAGATLTDSLILLSMSKNSHTGYMLSIPRDLYVKIPGHGYGKINQAYQDGGVSLLEQVISTDFNEPIDYYALIDYAAVRDTVNALGGITVDINSPDPRGLYDPNINSHDGGPLNLGNGPQTLNGQTALNLTRARGDAYGAYGFPQADFDRTQHQRQVLTAIKAKLNWKLVLNPRKNNQILNAAANNVKTDVKTTEIRSIFGLFNDIPSSKLQSIGLRDFNGKNYLVSTYYEGDTLSPAAGLNDFSEIDAALAQIDQQ